MPAKLEYDEIPIKSIEVSPWNVRKGDTQEGLAELQESIAGIGLQQPVVVYREADKYKMLIGQRRYLACKNLGWEKIPALIRPVASDKDAAIISFSENIHRLDLGYQDKMRVATVLLDKLGTINKVAEALGVVPQTVRNYLGYAGVPEQLKKMVEEKKISAGTATHIARNIPDEDKAVEIAKTIVETASSDRRKYIIEIAKENPLRSVSEIVDLSKKSKFRTITLHLTPRVQQALEVACRDYSGEPTEIANDALEEWLGNRGFLK